METYKTKLIPNPHNVTGYDGIDTQIGCCMNGDCTGSEHVGCRQCLFDDENEQAIELFKEWKNN